MVSKRTQHHVMPASRLKKDSFAANKDTLCLALYIGPLFSLVSPTPLDVVLVPVRAGADLNDASEGVRMK
jgi:hypothetical protein